MTDNLSPQMRETWNVIKYTYKKEYRRNQTLTGKGLALRGSNEAFQSCYDLLDRIFPVVPELDVFEDFFRLQENK